MKILISNKNYENMKKNQFETLIIKKKSNLNMKYENISLNHMNYENINFKQELWKH